jgi:hypothetical protein
MPVIKHKFVSPDADGPDSTQVRPSNWNDTHSSNLIINPISVNTTLDSTYEVVLVTAGTTGVTITLPTAIGIQGVAYYIKKIDSAAGVVTINTSSAQTMDGNPSYTLLNQYQFIVLVSDNSNWHIISRN